MIVTGHYGSGKTNLSVNLALALKKRGEMVTLVDLDLVNPYFCSVEYAQPLERRGIALVSSLYAGSNLETPALTAQVEGAVEKAKNNQGFVIIDAGGDDVGAAVLGRYSHMIGKQYEMLYVINACRYLTATPEAAAELLKRIESAARLKATSIVNNTNLGPETTRETVIDSMAFGEETAGLTGLPLLFTAADTRLNLEEVFPVEIVVRKPWETAFF